MRPSLFFYMKMRKLIETAEVSERAILVGLKLSKNKIMAAIDEEVSLDELAFLARTAGVVPLKVVLQKKNAPSPFTYIGKGKVLELKEIAQSYSANVILFDNDLSPSQHTHLEEALNVKVLDRTQVILDIFAQRARTSEGKLQVELAQLEYLLPRLKGEGILLSRLGGGIGTRGPGETKLETDRRHIRRRISTLKNATEHVRQNRELHRKRRKLFSYPLVALAGYTNAGKSTLLNALCEENVFVEDKLFATLDPTTRRIVFPNKTQILLTDTVGFIHKLPHHLITAFRATLEEVTEADILVHVVDASHPYFEAQMSVAEGVLRELGCQEKPQVLVFNKVDRMEKETEAALKRRYAEAVFVSALKKKNLDELIQAITRYVSSGKSTLTLMLSHAQSRVLSFLYEKGRVLEVRSENDTMEVKVEMDEQWLGKLNSLLTARNS